MIFRLLLIAVVYHVLFRKNHTTIHDSDDEEKVRMIAYCIMHENDD